MMLWIDAMDYLCIVRKVCYAMYVVTMRTIVKMRKLNR